jgi:hypothetical protein
MSPFGYVSRGRTMRLPRPSPGGSNGISRLPEVGVPPDDPFGGGVR